VPLTCIWAVDAHWSLRGCRSVLVGVSCPCSFGSVGALGKAYRTLCFQGALGAILFLLWSSACAIFDDTLAGRQRQAMACIAIAVSFGLLGLTASEDVINGAGFSSVGLVLIPLTGVVVLGWRGGLHAAAPIVVFVAYCGLVQLVLHEFLSASVQGDLHRHRELVVALFPILLNLLQRIARKALSRLPALRSRDEWGAGRWPKHGVATLATVFFAFGETLNLAVLVSNPSGAAAAFNLSVRLATGVSGRLCLLWRLKRTIARGLGRSLSINPTKTCRPRPPCYFEPKMRNRVSAIFLGNKGTSGYASLVAWLLLSSYGISFSDGLAHDACASLALIPQTRVTHHTHLFGAILLVELAEDFIVKAVHVHLLPTVTRRVLAPSSRWLTLQCLAQLFYGLSGFESTAELFRPSLLPQQNITAL